MIFGQLARVARLFAQFFCWHKKINLGLSAVSARATNKIRLNHYYIIIIYYHLLSFIIIYYHLSSLLPLQTQ